VKSMRLAEIQGVDVEIIEKVTRVACSKEIGC